MDSVKNKPASSLVTSLGKALYKILYFWVVKHVVIGSSLPWRLKRSLRWYPSANNLEKFRQKHQWYWTYFLKYFQAEWFKTKILKNFKSNGKCPDRIFRCFTCYSSCGGSWFYPFCEETAADCLFLDGCHIIL